MSMQKLSKENFDKIITTGLYKKEPTWKDNHTDTYWCKNWTFKANKRNGDRVFMVDTYFDNWDSCIELTDKNFSEFELIFDFVETKRIHDDEVDEYNECDVFRVATDSGGYACGKLHWVKKDAQKLKDLLIKKAKREVESAKSSLRWAESKLERLLEVDK